MRIKPFQPESVRGHQLERLRLRILSLPLPDRAVGYWDGRHFQTGTQSKHRTLNGRHINLIARIKRRIKRGIL